jgi:hypothetical protein
MSSATTYIDVNAPVSDEIRSQIAGADNNALIVRLMFTTNHLSRWLTPIHDPNRLERSLYRGEPTAKDLVIALRNEEQRVYPRLYLIATQTRANLDTLPEWQDLRRRLSVMPCSQPWFSWPSFGASAKVPVGCSAVCPMMPGD